VKIRLDNLGDGKTTVGRKTLPIGPTRSSPMPSPALTASSARPAAVGDVAQTHPNEGISRSGRLHVAKDGTPRSIPIGLVWNGSEIVMCTAKNAPKLPALRHNPAVALTIDTEVHPPKILLIRGQAERA
jgi:hypothetical protein